VPRINAEYAASRLRTLPHEANLDQNAGIAQLVEHHVANVDVASSNLVSRSIHFLKTYLLSPVLLVLIASLAAPAWAQEPAPDPVATATAEEPAEVAQSVDVSGRSQQALTRLTSIADEVSTLAVPEKRAQRIVALATLLDNEFGPMDEVEGRLVALSGSQLDDLGRELDEDQSAVGEESERLHRRALSLEQLIQEIDTISTTWRETRDSQKELPEALGERINRMLERAPLVSKGAQTQLNSVVAVQNELLALGTRMEEINRRLGQHQEARRDELFRLEHPPLWMVDSTALTESYGRAGPNVLGRWRKDARSFVASHAPNVLAHLVALVLILVGIRILKRKAESAGVAADETRILRRPVASGVLVALLLEGLFYPSIPTTIVVAFGITASLMAILVLRPFLSGALRNALYVLVVLYVVDRVLGMVTGGAPVHRMVLLALGISTVALAAVALQSKYIDVMHERGLGRSITRPTFVVGIALAGVGVVLNLLGNVNLATLLTSGVIRALLSLIIVFTLYLIANDLISLLMRPGFITRFRVVVRNRARIQSAAAKPVLFLAVAGWLAVTAAAFNVLPPTLEWLSGLLKAEAHLGDINISLDRVVAFIFAIWLAVVTSRITRAILADDVLPRFPLPRGVPNTIGVTVNYAIIIIGILIGAGFLGIDLSNLSLILGALGVGIGFGLQNIVNNVVSGLILIFERPIQVGDAVEVGTLFGRVTQIGLRASRVRTFSGSEIIVPNGDLVSQQVTNWTLSDRRRRLEVAVGVAYQSDVAVVQQVLMDLLVNDEDVLEDPEPMVIFEEFGDSALQFRMYFWIADFDESLTTRGRLYTEVNEALKAAGVEIPFPQRDLHLRSIQTDERLHLSGPGGGPEGASERDD
jgi:potassium efflux system protein